MDLRIFSQLFNRQLIVTLATQVHFGCMIGLAWPDPGVFEAALNCGKPERLRTASSQTSFEMYLIIPVQREGERMLPVQKETLREAVRCRNSLI